MNVDFTLGKCKTKAAFSAKLKKKRKLDLGKIKEKYEVILDTPYVVVVKVNKIEIIVHGYGELFFKNCEDISLMEKLAQEIFITESE